MSDPAASLPPALPDEARLARYLDAPADGPKPLFLTGGTAMRALSRVLKRYTYNSIHLITPFDSGGSSAKLRDAFDMLSVGDLRNRLLALADETASGQPAIYDLLAHRLPDRTGPVALQAELAELVAGGHRLMQPIQQPSREMFQARLARFQDAMPADFDLRGASLGNLVIAGGYLAHGRDIGAALAELGRLVRARGVVRPIADASCHLVARLADGTEVVGQHRITGKEQAPVTARIEALRLVDGRGAPATFEVDAVIRDAIAAADLICFPLGSFWTSVVANLLPAGVGRAIAASTAPKVFIPNAGEDPEMLGMGVHDCVEVLHRTVAADAGTVELGRVVDAVVVDAAGADYRDRLAVDRLQALGVRVIDLTLASAKHSGLLDADRLAGVLLSLC